MGKRLDISAALNVHLNWEAELESLVRGDTKAESLQAYEDCALGIWLHSVGMKKYGHYNETAQLFKIHKEFHKEAAKVVSDLEDMKQGPAEKAMKKVQYLSREIVYLLSLIELNSLEEEKNSFYPFRDFIVRLFYGPHHALLSDTKILDISHARLLHLRWAQSLSKEFRWGRKAAIEPAETCALGVWIHAVGLKQHKDIPQIKVLDRTHKAFHRKALSTIRTLSKKGHVLSDSIYLETLQLSKDILYLLSQIEISLDGTSSYKQTATALE